MQEIKTINKTFRSRCSILSDEQANIFGNKIHKLMKKYNNKVTTKNILKEATKKTSPIHDLFEWDDSIAGEKYRLWQVRFYKSVVVEIEIEEDTNREIEMPLAYNVSIIEKNDKNEEIIIRAYVSKERLISEKYLLNQFINNLLNQISYTQRLLKEFMNK